MKVRGRCHCGEITYEAEVKPGTVNVCHCRDCQMLSGTAFRAGIRKYWAGCHARSSGTVLSYQY